MDLSKIIFLNDGNFAIKEINALYNLSLFAPIGASALCLTNNTVYI